MTSFTLNDQFTKAFRLAAQWHQGRYRKGADIPYVLHLLGVASVALEFGASQDEAIAALLHGALENGPQYTGRNADDLKAEIEREFDVPVRKLVEGATDAVPEAGKPSEDWEPRKRRYLGRLGVEDASSLLVSASHKLHNARAILTDVLGTPPGKAAGSPVAPRPRGDQRSSDSVTEPGGRRFPRHHQISSLSCALQSGLTRDGVTVRPES